VLARQLYHFAASRDLCICVVSWGVDVIDIGINLYDHWATLTFDLDFR